MSNKKPIDSLPEVPDRLIEAVNDNNLVIFIGAGVSRLAGIEGWDMLAKRLLQRCSTFTDNNGEKIINYKNKQTLLQERDNKKLITICKSIIEKYEGLDGYYEELEKALKPEEIKMDIYNKIKGISALYLTTNADELFDPYFRDELIAYDINNTQHFNPKMIDNYHLYYLHGILRNRESLVFEVAEYIERYNIDRFNAFLKRIFGERTVLFLGYGLGEFEVLDHLITKNSGASKTDLKHYILKPYYQGEEDIVEFESYYFSRLGIEIVPYKKDERGYKQLYFVLDHWNTEINETSDLLDQNLEKLQRAAHAKPKR